MIVSVDILAVVCYNKTIKKNKTEGETMTNIIKIGTVYAGTRTPNIHNEIVKIYDGEVNGKKQKMVDVAQYGATLANKDHERNVTFTVNEIRRALRNGWAHVILAR